MVRTLTRTQLAVDISIAAFCVLVRFSFGVSEWPMLAVIVLMAGALALRRLTPGLALAIVWAGVLVQLLAHLSADISNTAIPAVLFVTARYGTRIVRWSGLASAVAGAVIASAYVTFGSGIYLAGGSVTSLSRYAFTFTAGIVASATLFVLSWTFGLLWRTWATARESRLAQQRALVQQQVAEREVAIEQERVRIARDMHDVVAHSLAVVIAQSDGARYAMTTDPGAADAALTTISATAREALADVRVLLGQLRHSQEAGPQPVLDDLDRLIEQMRGTGLSVRRESIGVPHPLPTGQQLAVYRIVQESLTNALRHGATGEEVVVGFAWTDATLEVEVSSTLDPERPLSDRGHGIDGMRERAVLTGGTLSAAPHGDRFVVTASLPLAAAVAG